MQVSVETTSSLERRLTIGVPSERIESEIKARLQKASGTVRISGFRPGKVPMKVLQQRFGPGVRQEVLGEVMSQSFYEAVTQENLKPASQPTIEPKTNEQGKDLEFIATFEVYPEIELADFARITVEKPLAEVKEPELTEMVANLRKQHATWEDVDRKATKDDQVTIDFKGTKDGEAFEGGSAEGNELILGSGQMIPGFEDGLEGLIAGESKTLDLTFPDDYHSEDLKGAAVIFEVTVHKVCEQKLAELGEEFFAKFGVTNGGEKEFREQVSANMQRELGQALKNKIKGRLFDQLISNNDVEVPQALVAGEIDTLRGQMMQQFGAAADTLDSSILPDEMFTDQAERRVKLGLLVGEVIRRDEIKVDDDRVKALIEEMARAYEDPDQVRNWYYGNKDQLASVESAVLEDQVVEKILESANVSEVECSYQEAVTPDPEPLPGSEKGAEAGAETASEE